MPVPVILNDHSANIVELFSSIQGEGILIGKLQAFLRLSDCNLSCIYCDTDHALSEFCNFETTPGSGIFEKIPNPVAVQTVCDRLESWKTEYPGLHHSLSITGGEPLLHTSLLLQWLPLLRSIFPIYLETNGTLVESLSRVINHIDIISMDIKLPSTSGHSNLWSSHADFLKISSLKQCYVKVVVSTETSADEIKRAAQLIVNVSHDIPLILQPVSNQLGRAGLGTHLINLQALASKYIQDVRVIPQTHLILEVF